MTTPIDWAKRSKQPLLFLKLDFAKAYNKVDWDFLFQILEKIGVDPRFISYIKLLFSGAAAFVLVNGHQSPTFQIQRGVRQGCLWLLYYFFS